MDDVMAMTYSSQAGASKMFDSRMSQSKMHDSKISNKKIRSQTAGLTKGPVSIDKYDPNNEQTKNSFMAPHDQRIQPREVYRQSTAMTS